MQFMLDRPLWTDEAALALNVIHKSVLDLAEPLELNQAAPAGFLLLVKLATLAFGTAEPALRLVPFLFGLASMILYWRLACRTLQAFPAVLATWAFAVSRY
jgi:hypothetical protein